jgi:hypothetical protein
MDGSTPGSTPPRPHKAAKFRVSAFCSEISSDWKQSKLVALLLQTKTGGFNQEVSGSWAIRKSAISSVFGANRSATLTAFCASRSPP